MKKALSYIFILFGLVVLTASTSRRAMQYISDRRDGTEWWCTYPCKHGDLVSMSYLDFVPAFNPSPGSLPKRADYEGPKNTVLVLHGDSYVRHLADSNFAGVSAFYLISRNNGGVYHVDGTKKNIMVIEVSERYLRSYFESTQIFNEISDTGGKKQAAVIGSGKYYAASVFPFNVDDLFNKFINQNLQCNLFNYNFIMPMFETKAALNFYLFNRASGDVVISDDRRCMFLKETVSKTDIGSSYTSVGEDEVKHIVDVLNTIYDHYKGEGFAEVYFSVIPNSATIMQPQGYNNLIPEIQSNPALRMKIIDIYSVFRSAQEVCYMPGDTHWNSKGKQLWIDEVNKRLMQ